MSLRFISLRYLAINHITMGIYGRIIAYLHGNTNWANVHHVCPLFGHTQAIKQVLKILHVHPGTTEAITWSIPKLVWWTPERINAAKLLWLLSSVLYVHISLATLKPFPYTQLVLQR